MPVSIKDAEENKCEIIGATKAPCIHSIQPSSREGPSVSHETIRSTPKNSLTPLNSLEQFGSSSNTQHIKTLGLKRKLFFDNSHKENNATVGITTEVKRKKLNKLSLKSNKEQYKPSEIASKSVKSEGKINPESDLSNNNTNNVIIHSTKRKLSLSKIDYEKINKRNKMYDYRNNRTGTEQIPVNANIPIQKDSEEDNENSMETLDGAIATLCNIGNSCYLNSIIYTLRFAPQFLHKLHHLVDDMRQVYQKIGQNKIKSSSLGRNVTGLQGQSGRSWSSKDLASLGNNTSSDYAPKTNRQIVTEKLHELYQNLHRNEMMESSEPFHAGNFLNSIQDVSSVFEGNQQQDAHELLMCILDSIRESCQSLIKLISDHPEVIANGCSTMPEVEQSLSTLQQQQQPQSQPSTMKFFFTRKNKRKDSKNGGKINPGSPMKIKENIQANSDMVESSMNNLCNDSMSDLKNIPNADAEKLNEKIKKLGLDFLREDFEGVTLSTTKCLTCESVTEQKETMIDIAIPIPTNENSNLIENPQLYFQNSCITREYFRVENHYRCDSCCGYTEAVRSISYSILPRLLVFHIKRFSGGMEKISSYIPTPFILKCFCNKCNKMKDEEKLHVYKLFSVITHVGATMSVGHYIAYTSSLGDVQNECASDKRKNLCNNEIGVTSEKSGLVKKLIYGRNKASSSGDLKPINGLSKMVLNGIEKLNLNSVSGQTNGVSSKTVCNGMKCCSIYVKGLADKERERERERERENHIGDQNNHVNGNNFPPKKHCGQQIWWQCDDEKIKVMSQKEFEELLSPNQKLTITPYLLFYARYDLNDKESAD